MSTLPLPLHLAAAPNFYGLTRAALADRLEAGGLPRYRADQLFAWVYQKHRRDGAAMSNLPAGMRERLAEWCDLRLPEVARALGTPDGQTQKFVLALSGGARIECVSMR